MKIPPFACSLARLVLFLFLLSPRLGSPSTEGGGSSSGALIHFAALPLERYKTSFGLAALPFLKRRGRRGEEEINEERVERERGALFSRRRGRTASAALLFRPHTPFLPFPLFPFCLATFSSEDPLFDPFDSRYAGFCYQHARRSPGAVLVGSSRAPSPRRRPRSKTFCSIKKEKLAATSARALLVGRCPRCFSDRFAFAFLPLRDLGAAISEDRIVHFDMMHAFAEALACIERPAVLHLMLVEDDDDDGKKKNARSHLRPRPPPKNKKNRSRAPPRCLAAPRLPAPPPRSLPASRLRSSACPSAPCSRPAPSRPSRLRLATSPRAPLRSPQLRRRSRSPR